MKKITHNRLLLFLFFSLFTVSSMAQNPCDVCNDPWGPVQTKILSGQTISSKNPACTYTFEITYRERNCGGSIELEIIDIKTTLDTSGPFCNLTPGDCSNTRSAAIRSLVADLGYTVTLSQEKSCYALFSVDPPQEFIDCFLSPGETFSDWSSFVECDASSCCSVTYTPNPDGTVNYTLNSSVPCTPGPPPSLPAFVQWECKGQIFIIPIDQNQPVDCMYTCPSGSGTIFKQAETEITELKEENSFILSPNPTSGEITLNYVVFETDQLELLVYNVQGQKVFNQTVFISNGSEAVTLNTEEWGSGIYTMRIQGDGELLDSQRIQVLR